MGFGDRDNFLMPNFLRLSLYLFIATLMGPSPEPQKLLGYAAGLEKSVWNEESRAKFRADQSDHLVVFRRVQGYYIPPRNPLEASP
jgi:hypothetical protein